jgi:acylphosphatase
MAKQDAIAATVTGQDQEVGFRALIMKQAIKYNLAGTARNEPDQVVRFTLQGRKKRINHALSTIKKGTQKSSDIKIKTAHTEYNDALSTFTIVDWTSSSRDIETPYNLVFHRRTGDHKSSNDQVEAAWHDILENTLDPQDLAKLRPGT